MTKNRFLQHVQKTEHINWASFGIPHAAQGKLFPKCNFCSQESTKSYRRITFFYQKLRDLHFLCLLIWSRFNFFWLDCLNLTRFWFNVSYICFLYTVEKNTDKKMKKNKKPYLPTYPIFFFEHVTPCAITRPIFIMLNQY